jgi:hypothetical protein
MRRATSLAALLAAIVTLVACGGTASAAKNMDVTLQDDGVFVSGTTGYDRTTALKQARALGVTRIRASIHWAYILPTRQAKSRKVPKRPAYNWSAYDGLIDAAAAYGLRVDLTLVGVAPAYATKNHRIGVNAPSARLFGSFAKAAAKHFKGRVNRYSIWNEPNLNLWLAPAAKAPRLYRGLYSAAYKAIKRSDRKALVLIGETSPYGIPHRAIAPIKFLRAVACVNGAYKRRKGCKPLVADGYAHHPYDVTHKPSYRFKGRDNATLGSLRNLTGALTRLARAKALYSPRRKALSVYLTEYGYYRAVPRSCSRTNRKRQISDAKDAKYTVQGFKIAQRNPRVRSMLQYGLVHSATECFATGIVNRNGKPTKVYTALKRWVTKAAKRHQVRKAPKRLKLPAAP